MKTWIYTQKLSDVIFRFSILFFVIGFNFQDSPPPNGWVHQPNTIPLSSQQISDMSFVDSSTAYAVTKYVNPTTPAYLFKTTNAGFNWSILRKDSLNAGFARVVFLDKNTGYICGQKGFEKTTNGGLNWVTIPVSTFHPDEMFILNQDTIWQVVASSLFGGLFRTTNGGLNWTTQWGGGSNYPKKLHMLNGTTGFMSTGNAGLYKTTNSGFNWTYMYNVGEFFDMYFSDSLTGYLTSYNIQKTTNGGANWVIFQLPSVTGAFQTFKEIKRIHNFYSDTLMGVYAGVQYLSTEGKTRAVIYKTTNGGVNWGYQIPDTSYGISTTAFIKFRNNYTGWSYAPNSIVGGIYTTNGGDSTVYTSISNELKNLPEDFILKQNYPNPFNGNTIIPFELKRSGIAKISIYDIRGAIVKELINSYTPAGKYEINFKADNLSSGVYFYRLEVSSNGNIYAVVKPMMYIK